MITWFSSLSGTAKGVLLALVSTALFVLVGVIVRQLSASIDPFQILFFRQLVFVALLMPAMVKSRAVLLKPNKIKLHLLRVSGASVALYFGFLTVSNIPFADASALGFIQVLFVAVISKLLLSEQIGVDRLFSIVVGFLGVMLVVQPSFDSADFIYVLCGVLASFGAAVAVICVRKVAQTEPRITLLAYQALLVGLAALLPTIFVWQWPTLSQYWLLLLVGSLSSAGQWIGVTAYKWAEANIVANVEYVKIIYSLVIGYWLFAEIPNQYAIFGAVVIILSGVAPLVWKRRFDYIC